MHRACNPSNEKRGTQRKNIFRKREEEKIIKVQLQMSLSSRAILILGALKEVSNVRMLTSLNSQLGHPGCLKVGRGACPSLPCPLTPAWHASPAGDGEGVRPSTGMVASEVCILLV